MGRRACRREVKATLRRIGLPDRRSRELSQADVTRSFLVEKCLRCLRCPKICRRLAAWKVRRDAVIPPPPR